MTANGLDRSYDINSALEERRWLPYDAPALNRCGKIIKLVAWQLVRGERRDISAFLFLSQPINLDINLYQNSQKWKYYTVTLFHSRQ